MLRVHLANRKNASTTCSEPCNDTFIYLIESVNLSAAAALQNVIMLNPWIMGSSLKPASPTLPNGQIPTTIGETSLQGTDDQTVKWIGPSSVDSNGQKTDSSAGETF